jgi:hypothetical protein
VTVLRVVRALDDSRTIVEQSVLDQGSFDLVELVCLLKSDPP